MSLRIKDHTEQAQTAQHGEVEGKSAAADKEMSFQRVYIAWPELGARATKLWYQHLNTARILAVKLREVAAGLLQNVRLVVAGRIEHVGEQQ